MVHPTIFHGLALITTLFNIIYFYRKYYFRPILKLSFSRTFIVFIMATFTFNTTLSFGELDVPLPILPFGYLAVFFIFKFSKSWLQYRPFAVLGFASNLLFITTSIVATLISSVIYPKDEVTTYIYKTQLASVLAFGEFQYALEDDIKERLEQFQLKEQNSDARIDSNHSIQLLHTQPKLGSLLNVKIYASLDGKELIVRADEQLYKFEGEQSIFQKVGE